MDTKEKLKEAIATYRKLASEHNNPNVKEDIIETLRYLQKRLITMELPDINLTEDEKEFITHYIMAIDFTETSDKGQPPAGTKLDPDFLRESTIDCLAFYRRVSCYLDNEETQENPIQEAGHDFWLTRNGHGAGFWDGAWPIYGDMFTKIAESFGESYALFDKSYISEWKENTLQEVLSLLKRLQPTIEDGFRIDGQEDDTPTMQVTIATDDSFDHWVYQTGDTSYHGACYGKPYWGIIYLTLDMTEDDMLLAIEEAIEQILENYYSQ